MKIYLILMFLFWSNFLNANCIKNDDLNDKELMLMSLYSLQGNQKEIDKKINKMKKNYYLYYYHGYSYLIGKNRLKDYDLAKNYLLKSAKYCFSPAHYSLGYLYYIEGNIDEAKKWFISSINLGDNLAAHQLALILKEEKNTHEMLKNLNIAISNDFLPSITELGVQYYDGNLIERDVNEAFKYFYKAAEMNDPLAQNNLGWMYEHGEGTLKDLIKAEKWYLIAAENGFELAIENLNRLNNSSNSKVSF